jgi:hypothetical protein
VSRKPVTRHSRPCEATTTRVRARRSRSKGSEEEGRNVGHFGCPHVGQFRVSLTEHPGPPSGDDVREPPDSPLWSARG